MNVEEKSAQTVPDQPAEPLSQAEMRAELERRGHVVTSWDELGSITLPTGAA